MSTPTLKTGTPAPALLRRLLVGNGASRAVWDDFGYDSLFENARTVEENPEPIGTECVRCAADPQFRTGARRAENHQPGQQGPGRQLGGAAQSLLRDQGSADQYRARGAHPVAAGAASTLATINQELARYRTVFTTNYDLLNYWAIQHSPEASTTCSTAPTPVSTSAPPPPTKPRLLYLHGGLHLVRNQDGTRAS
jgi:hypothetical protein